MSKYHREMVSLIREFSKRKWTDREYHFHDNANVAHKYVKVYCNTNKFPSLPFCGTYSKPHGAKGLSKYYHLRFDPKIFHWCMYN